MQLIKKKIQSRRGASITYALLLFLVCAVVGSVVLAAGTAASGRLAKLAESEQRFYAVNSAAELVVSQLCGDGNKVTIGMKKNADGTYTNTLPAKKTLASDLATYLVFGELGVTEVGSETQFKKEFPATDTLEFKISVDGNGDIPPVSVTAKLINCYQLNISVKNIIEDGKKGDQYILPTIILETDNPRGEDVGTAKEYTFNWRTPKG